MSHDALRQHPEVYLITPLNSNAVSYETDLQTQTHQQSSLSSSILLTLFFLSDTEE